MGKPLHESSGFLPGQPRRHGVDGQFRPGGVLWLLIVQLLKFKALGSLGTARLSYDEFHHPGALS